MHNRSKYTPWNNILSLLWLWFASATCNESMNNSATTLNKLAQFIEWCPFIKRFSYIDFYRSTTPGKYSHLSSSVHVFIPQSFVYNSLNLKKKRKHTQRNVNMLLWDKLLSYLVLLKKQELPFVFNLESNLLFWDQVLTESLHKII